jgi:hypothetical protein
LPTNGTKPSDLAEYHTLADHPAATAPWQMAVKHKARFDTPNGLRVCFETRIERSNRKPLVARLGGIPLQQQRSAKITDRRPVWVGYPQGADHTAPGGHVRGLRGHR